MPNPTQVTESQIGFAQPIEPYAAKLLAMANTLTDINTNPYQQYMGERFAQFAPLQQQSFQGAGQLQAAPQMQTASNIAALAGMQGLGYTGYAPSSFTEQGTAQQYMNPYMQQVLAPQMQAMQRQADIQRQTLGAQAAQAGAFGGARSAIGNQQLNAELMRQQQQATGQAYGQAFGQAQQQFNTEQAQRMQGAQLGLQGLQTALQGAGQLGALGQGQFGQNVQALQLQNQMGTQQQQQMQNILNQQYQDYLNAQNYPYKQLGFMSDIIRGVPLTQTGTALYQAPPTATQTLTSLGLGAAGLSKMFKKGGKVDGKPAGLPALVLSQIQ